MTSAELRATFIDFFRQRGHEPVTSSSLLPGNDPTLLFTNAGMVPFKDVFLGREQRPYTRATSSQRCVRAGGKHNDLENVGYTARHHTFFEMLGNFSFGDYFKAEAIAYAWEFLTQELKIPTEKLWITVFDGDQEAEQIWFEKVGIDPDRFSRIAGSDNFWSMGDVGPCGPCTEIFYDHGEAVAGGPPGTPEEDGDRYIEIWNLVFMQYDRAADGTLTPLPKPSVDTGMGLERLAAVMQGVHNNYDIDLFHNLIVAIAKLTGTEQLSDNSLRVIADHIRSCAFLVVDGVLPANEGRGYVLRRIIRRAIRHGYKLGLREPFFHRLVEPLVDEMGTAFPELGKVREHVKQVLHREEIRFAETLEQGMKLLESCIDELQNQQISGDLAFRLYDTYGFPLDLTADFAREQGLTIDKQGFEVAMEQQRDRARAASHFAADYADTIDLQGETEFTGYDILQGDAQITALYKEGKAIKQLETGDEAVLILDTTPFYAESGGQVGDLGQIQTDTAVFQVKDTQKQGDLYLHQGQLMQGRLNLGDQCRPVVDACNRQLIVLNHSATHLMHAALQEILGNHVGQKGSLVNSERLRFDFTHFQPVLADELKAVEQRVNEQIRVNSEVSATVMAKDEAITAGATALFGEKYGDQVRVLRIGSFSTELCGGTHVQRAGDIGFFKIITETGVAAGIRRIEAVTGGNALAWVEQGETQLDTITRQVKGSRENAADKVQQLLEKNKLLEKQLDRLKAKLANVAGSDLTTQAVNIDGLKVLAARLDDTDPKSLRSMLDQLKDKLGSAAVILATVNGNKVSLVAGVSKDQTDRIKAGDLVNSVAVQVGGKGGGRPDMAQAGGDNPAALDAALQAVPNWVKAHLS